MLNACDTGYCNFQTLLRKELKTSALFCFEQTPEIFCKLKVENFLKLKSCAACFAISAYKFCSLTEPVVELLYAVCGSV